MANPFVQQIAKRPFVCPVCKVDVPKGADMVFNNLKQPRPWRLCLKCGNRQKSEFLAGLGAGAPSEASSPDILARLTEIESRLAGLESKIDYLVFEPESESDSKSESEAVQTPIQKPVEAPPPAQKSDKSDSDPGCYLHSDWEQKCPPCEFKKQRLETLPPPIDSAEF